MAASADKGGRAGETAAAKQQQYGPRVHYVWTGVGLM